jgi:hypothetical protein
MALILVVSWYEVVKQEKLNQISKSIPRIESAASFSVNLDLSIYTSS